MARSGAFVERKVLSEVAMEPTPGVAVNIVAAESGGPEVELLASLTTHFRAGPDSGEL